MIYDVQKAGLLKRFSAFLLDIILIATLAVGFAYLLSLITNLDGYTETINGYYKEYGEKENVNFNISAEDFANLSEEEQNRYNKVFQQIFLEHPDALRAYQMSRNLPLPILTISLLLSFLVFEFIIPLCFKNGQTIGKKIFNLGVVFNNSVKITTFALFARTVLGKFTIETMVPLLLIMMVFWYNVLGALIGLIVVGLILLMQIILLIATKNNTFIHDILSSTVVVDMSAQMIFATTAELIAYKENLHEQEVTKSDY